MMLIAIVVLVCLLIFLSFPLRCNGSQEEGFTTYYDYYGYNKRYCPSCGWRSRYSCSNCTNCGYCITASGFGECVPGDSSGPYFRDDCFLWQYGDPYYYNTSSVYPVVKTGVYRRQKYNLRRPRRWKRWRNTY
jgi:hypothetical protein